MHPSKFLIYGLVDPGTGHLRYIGKSCSGLKRPRLHSCPSSLKSDTYKNRWVAQLKKHGTKPNITIIQEFKDGEILSKAEVYWIAYFKQMGCKLTNTTIGGDGAAGRVKTPEERLKISRGQGSRPFWDSLGRRWDSVASMSTSLNLSYMAVHHALTQRQPTVNGLYLRYDSILNTEAPKTKNTRIRNQIFELRALGISLKDIGLKVGKTPGAVASILSKNR